MAAHFREEFPAKREVIEKCIRCLREIADYIDDMHKNVTIASLTATSTGAASGILTILGLALAPVTAGGSLIFAGLGAGLGAAAAATGITASVSEYFIGSVEFKKAKELINECEKRLSMVMHPFDFSPECPLGPMDVVDGYDIYSAPQEIKANVKAYKVARANPDLKALAKQTTAVRKSTRAAMEGVNQVEAAFKRTALAMSKGTRFVWAGLSAFFLLYDTYSLIEDAKHLTEGAKAEMAAKIREKASDLEVALQDLNNLYEELEKRN